jgi:hypothetical protein
MRRSASIVIGNPLPKIARYSEVPHFRMIYASKNIDVLHVSCSAKFRKGCSAEEKLKVSLS